MPYKNIKELVEYGIKNGLMEEGDRIYVTNLILDLLQMNGYEEPESFDADADLEDILKGLLDYACAQGIIEDSVVYRDLFDAKLMNTMLSKPSEVIKKFQEHYAVSPKEATDFFYKFSCHFNAIN